MAATTKNIFVFVACGSSEHIDVLQYSISALKKFSRAEIVVLTDTSRNEKKIIHSSIVDVHTPENFCHHQASIFLKTSAHKYLPPGNLYCYLDADVIALNEKVDEIFKQYIPPVIFAKDHCLMDRFSPSAIKCNCAEQYEKWSEELKYLLFKYKDRPRKPENIEKKNLLLKKFKDIKKNKIEYAITTFRFWITRSVFQLDEDTFYDKEKFVWYDKSGDPLIYERDVENPVDIIENTTNFRNSRTDKNSWTLNGKNVFDCRCNHLQKQIKKTFNIRITKPEWQHWNGGVFLFNELSHNFLNAWHEMTLRIFNVPEWKTRDQGTLIATAWQFDLENHPTLPTSFNLIADYHQRNLNHLGNLTFKYENYTDVINPNFIHVYHHWGDRNWDVWNEVEKTTDIALTTEPIVVNSCWFGNSLGEMELLTINSYVDNGHIFRLWTYNDVTQPLPNGVVIGNASEIIDREQLFALAGKDTHPQQNTKYLWLAKIFQFKFLYEKGGWWTDMDVTCLKKMQFKRPYFFKSHHHSKVTTDVIKCPPKTEFPARCYDDIVRQLQLAPGDIFSVNRILRKHITELDLGSYIEHDVSNHDRWEETESYLTCVRPIPIGWNFIHWQITEWGNQKLYYLSNLENSVLGKLMKQYSADNSSLHQGIEGGMR